MKNCGQHCSTRDAHSNNCVLKSHEGAHVFGSLPCESGNTRWYVNQDAADRYPPCGFGGVLFGADYALSIGAQGVELSS